MDGLIQIDLNADLGEGVPTEPQIMPLLSSCNIACGGHFGDRSTVMATLMLAKQHGVKVGAHPGYPDKENFGRVVLDISAADLKFSIRSQLELFKNCSEEIGLEIHHIKPHGALYNEAAANPEVAKAVYEAIVESGIQVPLYTLPNSALKQIASPQYKVIPEAFVDRRYTAQGRLSSRSMEGSVIHQPEQAWNQLYELVVNKRAFTMEGVEVSIKAQTYCVHSDTPNALQILEYIHRQMEAHKIQLKK